MIAPEFLITAMVVILIPGTGVIYTLATGLTGSKRAMLAAAFGCTLSILPSLLAAILGLSALLHTSVLAFQIVKYAGVAFLLYMAWQTLRESGAMVFDQKNTGGRNLVKIALRGVLINALSPKLSIFFLAFLPQFLSGIPDRATSEMALLGGVFMALTFGVFVVYGLFASIARDRVISSPHIMTWLRRGFAATFAGLGLKLAFEKA